MDHVIFTKYSNDRSPLYRIRTDIVQKDDGDCYVRKVPQGHEAVNHINRLPEIYVLLKKQFSGSPFAPNQCWREDGDVDFEYISGQAYDEYLDELLTKNGIEAFQVQIFRTAQMIRSLATRKFFQTDEFKKMFPLENSDIFRDDSSMEITDLDMIFPNIILTDNGWEVLDYEWSFPFPIPVDFVIFRGLYYYENSDRKSLLLDAGDIYWIAGISEQRRKIFEKMESQFQSWILGDTTPLWKFYEKQHGRIFFPIDNIQRENAFIQKERVHIGKQFTDKSDYGYFEQLTFEENGTATLKVPIDGDERIVLLNFSFNSGVIYILRAFTEIGDKTFQTNGKALENNTWYYTEEPWLLFDKLTQEDKILTVHLELAISSRMDVDSDKEPLEKDKNEGPYIVNAALDEVGDLEQEGFTEIQPTDISSSDARVTMRYIPYTKQQREQMGTENATKQNLLYGTTTSRLVWEETQAIKITKKVVRKIRSVL